MRVVAAVKIYITAIPINTIIVGETFLNIAKMMIKDVGISENAKAFTIIPRFPPTGIIFMPKATDMVTPNNAPAEMPVVYESVRGFLIIVCIIPPPMARTAPTNAPTIALGTNPSQTMNFSNLSL